METHSVVIATVLLIFSIVSSAVADPRIYGGYPIDITDAPYMAHFSFSERDYDNGIPTTNTYLCGGTIVSKRFIMTAGHCATNTVNGENVALEAKTYRVRVGSTQSDTGGKQYRVSDVIPHPDYKPSAPYHDIALLRLTEDIEYDHNTADKMGKIQRITLARRSDTIEEGSYVYASGWGRNPDNPETDDLYQVDLKTVNSTYCARRWGGDPQGYQEHEVCATGKKGADVCQGDSGGPLIHSKTKRQIGLVSFGAICKKNKNNLPGVYTSIQDNLKWIYSTMRSFSNN